MHNKMDESMCIKIMQSCNFGTSTGLKRTLTPNEEKYVRGSRVSQKQLFSMKADFLIPLNQTLTPENMNLAQNKGYISKYFAEELNTFEELGKYQSSNFNLDNSRHLKLSIDSLNMEQLSSSEMSNDSVIHDGKEHPILLKSDLNGASRYPEMASERKSFSIYREAEEEQEEYHEDQDVQNCQSVREVDEGNSFPAKQGNLLSEKGNSLHAPEPTKELSSIKTPDLTASQRTLHSDLESISEISEADLSDDSILYRSKIVKSYISEETIMDAEKVEPLAETVPTGLLKMTLPQMTARTTTVENKKDFQFSLRYSVISPDLKKQNIINLPDIRDKLPAKVLLENIMGNLVKSTNFGVTNMKLSHTDSKFVKKLMQTTFLEQPIVYRVLSQQQAWVMRKLLKESKQKDTNSTDRESEETSQTNKYLLPKIVPYKQKVLESEQKSKEKPAKRASAITRSASYIWSQKVNDNKKLDPSAENPNADHNERSSSVRSDGAKMSGPVNVINSKRRLSNAVKKINPMVDESSLQNESFVDDKINEFFLPRLSSKPKNLLLAVASEMDEKSPFILDTFLETISRVIPETKWLNERSAVKINIALERLGADLLVYRQSSGHIVRYKLMSILAASRKNRILRYQLYETAKMHGNWLDQLLRSLTSVNQTCRTEAAIALALLAMQTKLMQRLIDHREYNLISDIFFSLFKSADYFPSSWDDFYTTLSFFIHYNQCQTVLNTLIDRGSQTGLTKASSCWPRMVAYIYTYWKPCVLKKLNISEKRMSTLLDQAYCNPTSKKAAKEGFAAACIYHHIRSNFISMWPPLICTASENPSFTQNNDHEN